MQEAGELVDVLGRDEARLAREIGAARESLRTIENELAPARQAVGALVQEEVSAIDMALGQASERQRQIGRLRTALATGERITDEIAALQREIDRLQRNVTDAHRSLDPDAAAAQLEDGMNAYLSAINQLRKGVWSHSQVHVRATPSSLRFLVGSRRWDAVLGGTDTLYFLMAYHYGLLSLTNKAAFHYPGLSIIDVPGEFSGEAVEDKENFIVQPFVDLLGRPEFEDAQVVITGASFTGLRGVHRLDLRHVFTA
jgi:DNA-binding transcriptional regulator GbsR (MarR family)